MARTKRTKKEATEVEVAEVAESSEETMAAHNHEELEAKIAALEARIAELEKNDLLEAAEARTHKIVEVAFEGVSEVVEAKVRKAVENIKGGKVDVDFEEIFQWFAKRRKRGRPFRR
jgi:hypothetical protein